MTDPIADMLTRIRNASAVRKPEVVIPHSKLKEQILGVLHQEGYVQSFVVEGKAPTKLIIVQLKYDHNRPVISSLKRISKSGRRVYAGKDEVPSVLNGLGVAIISTSQGLMTSQEARKQGVGGEVLCEVY